KPNHFCALPAAAVATPVQVVALRVIVGRLCPLAIVPVGGRRPCGRAPPLAGWPRALSLWPSRGRLPLVGSPCYNLAAA
ncbi:hypothetical protein BHE74_00042409, partial [Ensete ventricosum]